MSEQFSDDLKKGWKFGKKYKGRKVKPEKKKKRVQYTAENLNELRRPVILHGAITNTAQAV